MTNRDVDEVTVLMGYSNGRFTTPTSCLTNSRPIGMEVGNFNNDHYYSDLAIIYEEQGFVSLFFSSFDGTLIVQHDLDFGTNYYFLWESSNMRRGLVNPTSVTILTELFIIQV